MREIKFRRIYLNFDGTFNRFEGWGPLLLGDGFVSPSYIHGCKSAGDEQYTGLKDKNGKEIYEGDVCKVGGSGIGEIIYSEKDAMFKVKWIDKTFKRIRGNEESILPNHRITFEVIGNIHENPELL